MITILEEFIVFVISVSPEVAEDVKRLVTAFKQGRPDLASPPAADGEAALDAKVDAEIKRREP